MCEIGKMSSTEEKEIIRGEVIWSSNNEDGGGAGNRVGNSGGSGRGKVAEEMSDSSKFR